MAFTSNGRGTLVFKRSIQGVGHIRRASGTNDPVVLARVHAEVDDLIERGAWTPLRQIHAGAMKAVEVLGYQATFGRVNKPKATLDLCYIVQAQPSGNIKIGCAASAVSRIRDLQGATWETLTLLATLPGGWDTEQRLHWEFAAHHIAREWFRPAPEILALAVEYRVDGLAGVRG
jgi:hypothetical protein